MHYSDVSLLTGSHESFSNSYIFSVYCIDLYSRVPIYKYRGFPASLRPNLMGRYLSAKFSYILKNGMVYLIEQVSFLFTSNAQENLTLAS